MLKKILKLIVCIALPLLVGAFAGYLIRYNIKHWYDLINKPGFTPSNYIFAPVWIVLYILMGISAFMIWNTPANDFRIHKTKAAVIWVVQLVLNFLWSIAFFYYQQISGGALVISLLFLSIIAMIAAFFPINRTAALLQIPYLAWVLFATILNLVILELN